MKMNNGKSMSMGKKTMKMGGRSRMQPMMIKPGGMNPHYNSAAHMPKKK